MRRSSSRVRPFGLAAILVAAVGQGAGPRYRVVYDVRVQRSGVYLTDEVARGRVSGPAETGLRLALRADSIEVEALLGAEAEGVGDSVTLTADFVTRRRVGRSRRGLSLWERDAYRRSVRLGWGDTGRIYPFGRPRAGRRESLWVEIVMTRGAASGDIRPQESVWPRRGDIDVALEAVLRPRRARVALTLVRNDSVSAPRGVDLVRDGPPRRLDLVIGRGPPRSLELSLASPEPPQDERHRALALDADIVCLRVSPTIAGGGSAAGGAVEVACGRLNNVARRMPLPTGDTLVATFAWPGPR